MSFCVMFLLSCVTICYSVLLGVELWEFNVKKLKTLSFCMCKFTNWSRTEDYFLGPKFCIRLIQMKKVKNLFFVFRDLNLNKSKSLYPLINILQVLPDASLKKLFLSFRILLTSSRDLLTLRQDLWNPNTKAWFFHPDEPDDVQKENIFLNLKRALSSNENF